MAKSLAMVLHLGLPARGSSQTDREYSIGPPTPSASKRAHRTASASVVVAVASSPRFRENPSIISLEGTGEVFNLQGAHLFSHAREECSGAAVIRARIGRVKKKTAPLFRRVSFGVLAGTGPAIRLAPSSIFSREEARRRSPPRFVVPRSRSRGGLGRSRATEINGGQAQVQGSSPC